jgi:curved DNA-binding protein CbpA
MGDSLENQYDNDKFVDYYKMLDVDMEASSEEIKTSYIKQAKKYHPDQENGNTEIFQLVTKAYETLINKENRKNYDLYFLKKSFNELKEDDFLTMKDAYKDYININDKQKLTKDEVDKLYDDVFHDKEQYNEHKLDVVETIKRVNDINLERETLLIENNDDSLQNFIEKHPEIAINDVFEYIKINNSNQNKNMEITETTISSLDTMPGYLDTSYSSFIDGETLESNLYSGTNYSNNFSTNSSLFVQFPKEQVENINIDSFVDWKHKRRPDSKLNSEDIDYYLSKRKQEEESIMNEVETTLLNNVKKRTNVETFLKTNNNINEEDIHKKDHADNIKKRTV